jgi:glycine oxidase
MQVVVVGGGVIGLAVAWRALARGLAVTVVDPQPASKASHVSAGMLPAVNEMMYEQPDLLRLCLTSRARYRSFVSELEEVSGQPTGFRGDGLLDVAFEAEDGTVLDGLRRFLNSLDIPAETLTPQECQEYEPALTPAIYAGLLSSDDGSVNPRRLTAALLAAVQRLGGRLILERARNVEINERVTGVRLAKGDVVSGDRVVLAAGCWTHQIGGLPSGAVPLVRPVKGQILRLYANPPTLRRSVRGLIAGSSVYLVPRADGELVVGATYEEQGYDTTVTAGGLAQLLAMAGKLLPGVGRLAVAEFSAGLRPASPDDLPLLGETVVPGLLLATGHSRIGVQLSPATADVMVEALITGQLPEVAKPFSPLRFTVPDRVRPEPVPGG